MPYEVPRSKASLKQNKFEFTFPGSKKVRSVPLMKYLKPSFAVRLAEMDEMDLVHELFEAVAPGENLFEEFDDAEQLEAWVRAWQEASGITVGESAASSESSTLTERPSPETSSSPDSTSTTSVHAA